MSKQRIKRLQFILARAKEKEQQDLKVWGQYQQKLAAEEQTVNQLGQYMSEYQSSLTCSPSGGEHTKGEQPPSPQMPIKSGQMHNTIAFIEQLKNAIDHQQSQLHLIQQQVDGARKVYLKSKAKSDALKKLIEKREDQLSVLEEKQLQKLMDEAAGRMARNSH